MTDTAPDHRPSLEILSSDPEPPHAEGLMIDVAVCSARGDRRVNADAVVVKHGDAGRAVVALADGLLDTGAGCWAAALAAESAATAGATGDPVQAVLATGGSLVTSGPRSDAAVAVVVGPPAGDADGAWEVGWAGTCRVYAFDDVSWRAVSAVPSTARPPAPPGSSIAAWRSVDVLEDTVRTSRAADVGYATLTAPAWLLLVTDGVYRGLGEAGLRRAVARGDTPQEKADSLRDALHEAVLHDNATAVVVRCRPRGASALECSARQDAGRSTDASLVLVDVVGPGTTARALTGVLPDGWVVRDVLAPTVSDLPGYVVMWEPAPGDVTRARHCRPRAEVVALLARTAGAEEVVAAFDEGAAACIREPAAVLVGSYLHRLESHRSQAAATVRA